MKTFFKDFGLLFSGAFLLDYLEAIFRFGPTHYRDWLFPTLHGVYYGIICYVIWGITMRLLKSKMAFCIASWAVLFLLLYMNITGGKESKLTQKVLSYYAFVDGKITDFGIIYEMINPVGIMAVYATILLIVHLIKKITNHKYLPESSNE